MIDRIARALVLAPHPDDEVLGVGGVMARLANLGARVEVAIVTEGKPPQYSAEQVAAVRAEAGAAHARLGIAHTHYLGLPAAGLDRLPHAELNRAIGDLVVAVRPDTLFVPFPGDIHRDHQLVFEAAMVAARPAGPVYPLRILAYETLSETNWNAPFLTPAFTPNVFIDIADTLETKLAAFAAFASQVRAFPAERSVEALSALARLRGATVHRAAAEAFVLVREVG
ncbi:PIG-L domain-containing protein [Polymorphobacter glacialis]|uniref:PIG-L domain-containing protein n=1 Tax=Sandarakinorhabdus glacialis TaxID=1614636 RepID=A0A917E8S8_9SPHN|nr:PIG-L deacetylase family protein [Polymorphobacter glacialis]GGE14533.1 PIG-L domain-containing protein [Polymorphobacter glacialis]